MLNTLCSKLFRPPPGPLRLSALYGQLGLLLQVGFSIDGTLKILSDSDENPVVRDALSAITESVLQGMALSEACVPYPNVFPTNVRALIEMGEETGDLSGKFLAASELFKRQHEIRTRWKEAVRGPLINAVSFFVFIAATIKFILPHFVVLYDQLPIHVSFFSRLLFAVIRVANTPWFLLTILGSVILFIKYRIEIWNTVFEWGLKVPVFKRFMGKMLGARFADSLASLYKSGVTISASLALLARTASPEVYSNDLAQSLKLIENGLTFPKALSRVNYFPKVIGQMLVLGEETGKMDKLLKAVATYLEEDCRYAMIQAATVIEPVSMAVLGGFMAVVFISLLLPLYQLVSQLA